MTTFDQHLLTIHVYVYELTHNKFGVLLLYYWSLLVILVFHREGGGVGDESIRMKPILTVLKIPPFSKEM